MRPDLLTWPKRIMLVCMVVLGVQLCFPLTLQASLVSAQHVDMISLGVKDPAGKPGVNVDFDLPPVKVVLVLVPERINDPVGEHSDTGDVEVCTLLPVCGLHPSAP
jgi:hypothetical protein